MRAGEYPRFIRGTNLFSVHMAGATRCESRAKQPETARDLAQLISRCAEATQWSIEDADAWWGRHERGQLSGVRPSPLPAGPTGTRANDMTIDHTVKRP